MPRPTKSMLGTGLARGAAENITRRSAEVDRAVESSVKGPAKKASAENQNGQRSKPVKRGTTLKQARKTEHRGSKGERAFGTPIK